MAKNGRGNKAIDNIPAELRRQLDALLDLGTSPTDIYEDFPAVQAAMDIRTLQRYAAKRRRAKHLEIAMDAKAFLTGLLDKMEIDRGTLTPVEQALLGGALKELLVSEKSLARLGGIDAVLKIQKDRRKQAEHELKMRLGEAKARIECAATEDKGTGRKVVDLETVAKALFEADMAR